MMSAAVDAHSTYVRDSMRHECMCACRERVCVRVCGVGPLCSQQSMRALDACAIACDIRVCVCVCLERERERVCVLWVR